MILYVCWFEYSQCDECYPRAIFDTEDKAKEWCKNSGSVCASYLELILNEKS